MKKLSILTAAFLVMASLLLAACGTSQPKTVTVGVVNLSPTLSSAFDGFKEGLTEQGYVEGENVTYIYDGPVGSADALDPAIQKLVEAEVDLIFALSTPATLKAKKAVGGTDIPLVFAPVSDPVGSGVVADLRNPGGNLTGIKAGGSGPKALDWLMTIVPDAKQLFVLHNPDDSSSVQVLASLEGPAAAVGVELVVSEVRNKDEAAAAMANVPEGIDAVFILPSSRITAGADAIVQAAIEQGMPTATTSYLVEKGVLMTYGAEYFRVGKQAARLADQILKGAKAGDLPVETAEFVLGVNLPTAEAIGLDISDEILRQADVVIR